MRCWKCGADNREGARFCEECGANLLRKCPSCGVEYRPYAKFCDSCGAVLGGIASPADTKPKQPPRTERDAEKLEGERRHLSVVFCDLVDSTGLSHRLDPEESRAIVLPYQRVAAREVEQFGGHVAKFLGDGVMALFGWPQAHEDDAERAIRAALSILEAISALNQQSQGPELSTRIGIHTGTAVIAAGGDSAPDVFGAASNLASRAQSEADSNTVVITATTQQVVSGRFVVESLGKKRLKGIDEPLELFRVIRPSGTQRHLATAAARGLTPFVGREDEMRTLMSRWELARKGEGQVVLIVGEAGIGKSRLVQQFCQQVAGTPHARIQSEFSPYLQNTPFASIADILQQALGWDSEDSVEAKLAQLEQNLQRVGLQPAQALPLIAHLLNLQVPQKYQPLQLSPEQRRKRLLATLTGWLFGMARVQPLVLVLEDMHWADPSTLEFHQTNVEQGATVPLLLLCTTRPEFRAPWPMHAHHAQITLGRLRDRDIREMVHAVAARATLTEPIIDALASRSSGVPLFVEELTRAVVESGERGATEDIPGTLHNSLAARLDRLGAAREVAQVAAVIGREFSYELLRAISQLAEGELQSALNQLADAELVYARGVPPAATYQFKHALIRDAAYEGLLKSRRKDLHRIVAQKIEEQFPAIKEARPEVLARHWTEAGENDAAIVEWSRAGKTAHARNAFKEAAESYQQALVLLRTLPEPTSHVDQELELQTALSLALVMTRGLGAPEVREAYDYARKLCQRVGDTPEIFPVLFGLCNFYIQQEEMRTAQELAEQILDLAERQHDPERRIAARRVLCSTSFWCGDFAKTHEHCEEVIALYNPDTHSALASVYGTDPCVAGLSLGAWALWYLGYPDRARKRAEAALALAREIGHHFTLAMALDTVAWTYVYCRNGKRALELADAGVTLSTAQEFPHWHAMALEMRGRARIELGYSDGIADMSKGRDYYHATGAKLGRISINADLARRLGYDGGIAEGLRRLDEALSAVKDTGLRHYEAEINRFRGELLLNGSNEASRAEQCFREAVEIARSQSARSLELRATTSLARLLLDTGRSEEARAMLTDIYTWFTEGFDTADLMDAKALLDELAS